MERRTFLAALAAGAAASAQPRDPWYRRTYRWGQTNITEKDPARYDVAFWRDYWKRTRVQGVIINAGGIVAYYPSRFPLHQRAQFLEGRDLYGELAAAAHEQGLAVLARMDSNRTSESFFREHPAWFSRDDRGEPVRAGDKYVTCINGPYYEEYLPDVMREIIERSHPEGLTDNSWAGLDRGTICRCENCARRFRDGRGHALPEKANWEDPVYREWILWNYARRTQVWEFNNRVTQDAGGPHCLWLGMNSGSVAGQARTFRDLREICRRAEILMLDHQGRNEQEGFEQNSTTGKLLHGVLGQDKLIPESMAMYQNGRGYYRLAAKPAVEARMWMLEGFAGGIQPWWHHVGAFHEDRRAYRTAESVMRWHEANQEFLVNRRPLASVGVVWSQRNTDFYGRDQAEERTEQPFRGWMRALVKARIPFVPVHVDDIAPQKLAVLILPNVAAMSDAQCDTVRAFVARGGAVIATGVTSLFQETGEARSDFALADLFGVHARTDFTRTGASVHSYVRVEQPKHELARGFEETAILPFGGELEGLTVDGASVLFSFIPAFPTYPPETAWMRTEKTATPAATVRGRVLFLPADVDRRYARDLLPDHARLLANAARWAASGDLPLQVDGPGLLDCNLYEQIGRRVLHIVNLSGSGSPNMDENLPTGPITVRVRGTGATRARLQVSGTSVPVKQQNGWSLFEIPRISDHELAIL